MGQFVVRNIEDSLKIRLQRRARRNGRSMEEEVRDILRDVLKNDEGVSSHGLGTEISGLFRKAGLANDIQELRGREIEPPSFDK